MKKITTILLIAIILFTSISCNMDSSSGLFQMAGESVRIGTHTIYSVLHKFDDNNYLVSTDSGVLIYNGLAKTYSKGIGNGNNSRMIIKTECSSLSSWSVTYFDSTENKFYTINNEGNKTEDTSYSSYTFKHSSYDRASNSIHYILSDNSTYLFDSTPLSGSISNYKYVGNGKFFFTEGDKNYLFTTTKEETENQIILLYDSYIITSEGKIYDGSTLIEGTIGSVNTKSTIHMIKYNENKYYIINNGSLYKLENNTLTSLTIQGLANVEIIELTKATDSYLNAISATNDSISINITSKQIENSWK